MKFTLPIGGWPKLLRIESPVVAGEPRKIGQVIPIALQKNWLVLQ